VISGGYGLSKHRRHSKTRVSHALDVSDIRGTHANFGNEMCQPKASRAPAGWLPSKSVASDGDLYR
jgi:hypothetical protein